MQERHREKETRQAPRVASPRFFSDFVYDRDRKNSEDHTPESSGVKKTFRVRQVKEREIIRRSKNPAQPSRQVPKGVGEKKQVHEKCRVIKHMGVEVSGPKRQRMVHHERLVGMIQTEPDSHGPEREAKQQDSPNYRVL